MKLQDLKKLKAGTLVYVSNCMFLKDGVATVTAPAYKGLLYRHLVGITGQSRETGHLRGGKTKTEYYYPCPPARIDLWEFEE